MHREQYQKGEYCVTPGEKSCFTILLAGALVVKTEIQQVFLFLTAHFQVSWQQGERDFRQQR